MISLGTKGYTLVEIIVVLAVTGLLATVVTTFFVSNLTGFANLSTRADLLSQAQVTLDAISADIRSSASADQNNRVEDYNAPGGLLSWQASSTTLILATAAENSAGDILFADAARYISHKNNVIYYLNDKAVYKRVLGVQVAGNEAANGCSTISVVDVCPADKKILQDVTEFSVKYFNGENVEVAPEDARSVEVSTTLNQQKSRQNIDVSYKTRTVFRND